MSILGKVWCIPPDKKFSILINPVVPAKVGFVPHPQHECQGNSKQAFLLD